MPKADAEILGEKVDLLVASMPLEALVRTLKAFPGLERGTGAERRLSPLTPAEEANLFGEWERFSAQTDREPVSWDRPLTSERRRRETARVEVMRSSVEKMRAILQPYRAWVEGHFGKGVFPDPDEPGAPR